MGSEYGLQERRSELEGEGDKAKLAEIQPEVFLEDRVESGNQRLDEVVEEVAETNRNEDRKDRIRRLPELLPDRGAGGHPLPV